MGNPSEPNTKRELPGVLLALLRRRDGSIIVIHVRLSVSSPALSSCLASVHPSVDHLTVKVSNYGTLVKKYIYI